MEITLVLCREKERNSSPTLKTADMEVAWTNKKTNVVTEFPNLPQGIFPNPVLEATGIDKISLTEFNHHLQVIGVNPEQIKSKVERPAESN